MASVANITRAEAWEALAKRRFGANISRGMEQCRFVYKSGDSHTCCALQKGHPGRHVHTFVTPSPKPREWFERKTA